MSADEVASWITRSVFDSSLWIWVADNAAQQAVALGIADFDSEIREGSLEWIQVLPEYRRQGFGSATVHELLNRLQPKAEFATVSGEIGNATEPEALYRRCGFIGKDTWYVGKLQA